MTTDLFTQAPNLFAQLRELWLGGCARSRDPEAAHAAIDRLDDHMRRDIGLGPKEPPPFLSRADILLQLHR